jgi:hypothetical protein
LGIANSNIHPQCTAGTTDEVGGSGDFGAFRSGGGGSCPNVPTAPPGADVRANMARAREYRYAHIEDGRLALRAWFASMVGSGGPWDYKLQGRAYPFIEMHDFSTGGFRNPFEAFGNFNYGATGATLGFSYYELQNWAGILQMTVGAGGGKGFPIFVAPYGDESTDASFIHNGVDFARNGC